MIIQIKNSGNTGNVPLTLANGELALNFADQKLFYKHANGAIVTLADGTLLGNTTAIDQYARDTANGAFLEANTSHTVANAAYAKANGAVQVGFTTLNIAGQNNVVATSNNDTLKFVAGESIVLTTDAPNNIIQFTVGTLNGGTF